MKIIYSIILLFAIHNALWANDYPTGEEFLQVMKMKENAPYTKNEDGTFTVTINNHKYKKIKGDFQQTMRADLEFVYVETYGAYELFKVRDENRNAIEKEQIHNYYFEPDTISRISDSNQYEATQQIYYPDEQTGNPIWAYTAKGIMTLIKIE